MNVSIVAIPLLAAIALAPAPVAAQDPAPEPAPIVGAARKAVSRPPDSPGRAVRPSAAPRTESPATATPPATTTAEADDQRGRGGNRGRDNGGGNRGGTGSNAGGDRGRNNGGDRDRDNNRGGGPRIAAPRPPNVSVWSSSSRNRDYYPPAYYDRWARQTYRWSPLSYVPWGLVYGSVGYSNYGYYSYGNYGPSYGYGYGYGSGYGQGPWSPWGRSTSYDTGGIRLRIRPRDAQVFVNGYYAGLVDDFDGNFQQLRLEQGGHKLEFRMPGFENLQLDVHVQPNRTITIREDLKPRP